MCASETRGYTSPQLQQHRLREHDRQRSRTKHTCLSNARRPAHLVGLASLPLTDAVHYRAHRRWAAVKVPRE
eukprot:64464-Prymnesium_polylepis.4